MAAVPITLDGVLYDLLDRTTRRVIFIGDASLSGLSVGGGPMPGGPGNGQPPIPGGPPPHPAFPIWGGPGAGFPDKPGYPPVVGGGPIIPAFTPPKPGDATPPPDAPPMPTEPPPPTGAWYWQGLWQMWVWVPSPATSTPPPDMGNVGPAHPIQPTVPEPKTSK
jgi:hypothetical protein